MDRNIIILMIFLLLLMLYHKTCNSNIIEGSKETGSPTSSPTGSPTGSQNNSNFIIDSEKLLNGSRNSFTYENTYKATGPLGRIANFLAQDLDLDSINAGTYSDTVLSSLGMTGMSVETNNKLCDYEYPNPNKEDYDVVRNGSNINLYELCKDPSSISRKRATCLLNDTQIPLGKDSSGNDVYKPYYMYDNYKDQCTYTPPSFLTTGQYCNVHEDETACLKNKTSVGKYKNEPHCQWVKSFRSYPNPSTHETEFCSKLSIDNCSSSTYIDESGKDTGRKICSYSKNNLAIKSKNGGKPDGDSGKCEVDPAKYIGGVSFETVKKIPGTDQRYISDGVCMDNCSVTSEKDCNDRFSCLWIDNAAPSRAMKGISASEQSDKSVFTKASEIGMHGRPGMCINKEIFYEMQNKEIYDQSKMCHHFDNASDCNNGRENDDSWHCIMKKFAGSCIEAGQNNKSEDGKYERKKNVPACQTILYDYVKTQLGNVQEYIDGDESVKSGMIYDYIANHAPGETGLKNYCNNYKYPNASITDSNNNTPTGTPDNKFCKWKEPPKDKCMYKTGSDLSDPGGLNGGEFRRDEPAYYYNNMFPPHCNQLSASECSPINCSWTGTKCQAKCIRLGSNTTRCGKSADDQKKEIKDTLNSQVELTQLKPDDVNDIPIDDYSHCEFNPNINTCVLSSDKDLWKSAPDPNNRVLWSSEIPNSTPTTTP